MVEGLRSATSIPRFARGAQLRPLRMRRLCSLTELRSGVKLDVCVLEACKRGEEEGKTAVEA